MQKIFFLISCGAVAIMAAALMPAETPKQKADKMAAQLEPKLVEWRRDFHKNPELSNREFKTAEKVATFLRSLGMEVQTNVGKTGVVGILKGGKPGPVVALRADMDALPVTERSNLEFASTAKSTYNGQDVGVMHACGHDAHMSMLMGAAQVLSSLRSELKGTIKFIFQPAEEGPPAGEEGGAPLMIKEGVLDKPKVDVIFGMHIRSDVPVGQITYRPEGIMAGADVLNIKIKGKQAHGATPWASVDPIVVSAQVITGLQTIVSRQTELTEDAAVITIGSIHGGVRSNIIPEEVDLLGTIRTFDPEMRKKIHDKIVLTATKIAESAGATAEVKITPLYAITYNDPPLLTKMLPTLQGVAGKDNVSLTKATTLSEDFSFFQEKIPGLYFFLGAAPKSSTNPPAHHTPDFFIDESGMKLGVMAYCHLALDYMDKHSK